MAQDTHDDSEPRRRLLGVPALFVLAVVGCLACGYFVSHSWMTTLAIASGIAVTGLIASAYLWGQLGKGDKALSGVLAVTVVVGLSAIIGAVW